MQADELDMSEVSGPQLHVKAVFEGLKKRGHTVRLLAIQKKRVQWTDDLVTWYPANHLWKLNMAFRFIERPIRYVQGRLGLPFFRFFDSLRFANACVSIFRKFDLLYERDETISYGGLIASRRLGIPIVLEVNGDLIEEWKQLDLRFSKVQRRIIHILTWMIYRYVSHIVSVGETLKLRLIKRWNLNPNHISVVTNGADISLFLQPFETNNIRKKYLMLEGPIIVFSGGFQPWHGIELILDGFSRVAKEKKDVTMILIGDGPMKPEQQKRSELLKLDQRVIFAGKVEHKEVAAILNAADIAIIYHRASAAEIVETPLKLFEYMAAGKAIIAPDVPNMRRLLNDHEHALLVPPEDQVALANAIICLLEDHELCKRIGISARNEAIRKHSWDRVVLDLEKIFSKIIKY